MKLKKTIFGIILGFSLGQAFNVATNPLTNQGFVENVKVAVTEPGIMAYSAIERPADVGIPLVIAGVAAAALLRGRKKDEDGKPATAPTAPTA